MEIPTLDHGQNSSFIHEKCNGHFFEYFPKFLDSKSEGQRKRPEKWVFLIFHENKTDTWTNRFSTVTNYFLLGALK
jgi:hypothetical protein